jgi:kynurenine 3-monooxygenase
LLNEELLEALSSLPNIKIYFRHKILSADFDKKFLSIRDIDANKEFSANFDFCIGADGSYSIIRRQMMRVVKWVAFLDDLTLIQTSTRMDYQQEYINDEYVELKMPSGRDKCGRPTFLLDSNHLHIWPRHSFMLIALPNKVCKSTFTSRCRLASYSV